MSTIQFAMVEELASLVKDNLTCKHLILSVEEALVDFLQNDTSSSTVLELEPMNPYNRLLLHRLADIFGFSHESVGEGDDRHLILERCPETAIPCLLVGDILWQYDEPDSPVTSHLLLKRQESPPVLRKITPLLQNSLEEREAAYLAARERIFARDLGAVEESVKQRPRIVPVVANRMIAHALGKRINTPSEDSPNCKSSGGQTDDLDVQSKVEDRPNLTVEASASPLTERKASGKQSDRISDGINSAPQTGRVGHGADEEHLKREHLGAAKRMFAHALGKQSGKTGMLRKCSERKHVDTE